jgi:hypothetical protein
MPLSTFDHRNPSSIAIFTRIDRHTVCVPVQERYQRNEISRNLGNCAHSDVRNGSRVLALVTKSGLITGIRAVFQNLGLMPRLRLSHRPLLKSKTEISKQPPTHRALRTEGTLGDVPDPQGAKPAQAARVRASNRSNHPRW